MSLLRFLRGHEEKRGLWSGPLTSSSPELARLWAAPSVSAGVHVNLDSALAVSTFYACVTLISQDIASLPLMLYRRLSKGGKERFDRHPLYSVLHDEPNPEQTSFQFRAALLLNCLCVGNGYAEIVRDGMRRPRHLWHLDPCRVTVVREQGRLRYRVTQPDGGVVTLDPTEMIHIKGPSWNATLGYDMTVIAREALGLAIASERFGGKYFANGSQIGGVLSPGEGLTELARKNLVDALAAKHQGVDRAHQWLLAPTPGTTFTPTAFNPRDSQMTELRAHQVVEICRAFRVPPVMIGDLSRATWANYGEARLQYFTQAVSPLLTNVEQELSVKLISPMERSQQVIEHNAEGFLRGAPAERADFYVKLINAGVYSVNEVRERENLAPISGGNQHRVPMNFEALTADPESELDVTPARMAITLSAHRDLLLDAMVRWLWKISDRALRQSQPGKLRLFAETELRDRLFSANFIEMARPALRAWLATQDREADVDTVAESLARYHIDTYFPALLSIAEHYQGEEFEKALQQQISIWRENPRLHRVVDHLIQFGVPPPVTVPTRPSTPALGQTVKMLGMRHKTLIAKSEVALYQTPQERMQSQVEQWERERANGR